MTSDVKFCAVLTMRYMNKALMQSCHDYIASHMPPPPKGLIAMRSFHIAPDRGMSLCYFDTNENLNAAFPSMKEFQRSGAAKFLAKAYRLYLANDSITRPYINAGFNDY